MTTVTCATIGSLEAELAYMERFYGPAPPAAYGIGNDGTLTEYYDERPKLE